MRPVDDAGDGSIWHGMLVRHGDLRGLRAGDDGGRVVQRHDAAHR
jgi:hypothetical protein